MRSVRTGAGEAKRRWKEKTAEVCVGPWDSRPGRVRVCRAQALWLALSLAVQTRMQMVPRPSQDPQDSPGASWI